MRTHWQACAHPPCTHLRAQVAAAGASMRRAHRALINQALVLRAEPGQWLLPSTAAATAATAVAAEAGAMQRLRQRARAGGSAARELEAGKLCACTRVHGVRFVLSLMRLCSMVHLVWVLCACVHGVCLWVCMCVFYDVPDVFVFYDVPGAWVFWCPWCGFLCVL